MKSKRKKMHRIFTRFLLSYMIILMIPLSICGLFYQQALKIVEEDAQNANMAILAQSMDILNGRLMEMDSLITQLSWNSKIKNLLYLQHPVETTIYTVRDTWRDLSAFTISNNFISTFFIHFKNNNIILTPYASYIRLSTLYGNIFSYGDFTYEEFQQSILNHHHHRHFLPAVPVMVDGKTTQMIMAVQSIPFEYPTEYKGNIMFFIDEREIHKLMDHTQIENGGWAYIADSSGNILSFIGSDNDLVNLSDIIGTNPTGGFLERVIAGKKMNISYTTSPYNGWHYVAAMPYDVVMAKVAYMQNLIIIFIGTALLLGVIIAYYLAYNNSKPVKDTLKILNTFMNSNENRALSEYEMIKGSIIRLIDNNKSLQQGLRAQAPMRQAAFLDRLYRGEFNNTKEMNAVLTQTEWDIQAIGYAVLIVQINGYGGLVSKETIEELNLKRLLIREIVIDMLKVKAYSHNVDIDKVALLLCFDTDNDSVNIKYTEGTMGHAKVLLADKYDIKTTISASNIYLNLQDACYGFDEAKQALAYQISDGARAVIWYKNIITDNSIHHYPIEIESKLVNFVRTGDNEKVEKLYRGLYVENFMRRNLSPEMRCQLFYELRGTLFRLMDEIQIKGELYNDIKDKVMQLYNGKGLEEVSSSLLETFLQVCNIVNDRKKSHNTQLKDKIIDFIHEHYTDSALCLNILAAHFEVTEFYLSQFFKEQAGNNFSNYLEKVRIDKAYEFLCKTDLSVDEISVKVGYNSAHAFRRAFKRICGVVPSACRDAAKVQTSKTQHN